jgi:uncharacterized membrane protein
MTMNTYEKYLIKLGSALIDHWLTVINLAMVIFIVPILLYPAFMATGNSVLVSIAGVIHAAYHATCHQLPDRSLFLFGYEMAVCARCFAIYASFLAGGILFYFLRGRLKPFNLIFYVILCIPMAIDGFSQLFGVPMPRGIGPGWQLIWTPLSDNGLRVITGAIFGLGSALFVLPYMQSIFEAESGAEKPADPVPVEIAPKA